MCRPFLISSLSRRSSHKDAQLVHTSFVSERERERGMLGSNEYRSRAECLDCMPGIEPSAEMYAVKLPLVGLGLFSSARTLKLEIPYRALNSACQLLAYAKQE